MNDKVNKIIKGLKQYYPQDNKCYLNFSAPHELLIATILSAQCTDERVNLVTKDLFQKYKTVEDFAFANLEELSEDVKSTGFFRTKAKHIIGAMQEVLYTHGGQVPSDIELLTKLPGVGRKTANVVRSHIFHIPSIVVDTHVKRISKRLGLTENTDPVKVEFDLMEILPQSAWIDFNQQVIAHGRKICKARGENCDACFFLEICTYGNTGKGEGSLE